MNEEEEVGTTRVTLLTNTLAPNSRRVLAAGQSIEVNEHVAKVWVDTGVARFDQANPTPEPVVEDKSIMGADVNRAIESPIVEK